jgi:hypothetical protein
MVRSNLHDSRHTHQRWMLNNFFHWWKTNSRYPKELDSQMIRILWSTVDLVENPAKGP